MKKKYIGRIIAFLLISIIWVVPMIIAVMNSFKKSGEVSTSLFSLPAGESFAGIENYKKALTFGNYPFL